MLEYGNFDHEVDIVVLEAENLLRQQTEEGIETIKMEAAELENEYCGAEFGKKKEYYVKKRNLKTAWKSHF